MNLTKDKRDRLLGTVRPYIRPFTRDDLWVMWAAYDLGSFPNIAKMTKEEFVKYLFNFASQKSSCLVVEDNCKWFKERRGPVAFISIDNYGWRIEPQVEFFKWATPRIILRCNVSFFQMVRYSNQIGVCVVRSKEKTANLFDHLREYGVLFPCGKIPEGAPEGDEYLYYVRGRHALNGTGRNVGFGGHRNRGKESPVPEGGRAVQRPDLADGRKDGFQPAETAHRAAGQREASERVT